MRIITFYSHELPKKALWFIISVRVSVTFSKYQIFVFKGVWENIVVFWNEYVLWKLRNRFMYDHLYKYFLYVVSLCKKWNHLNLTLLVQEISLSDEVVCLRIALCSCFVHDNSIDIIIPRWSTVLRYFLNCRTVHTIPSNTLSMWLSNRGEKHVMFIFLNQFLV